MRLWVTRSEPGASRMADYLHANGHSCLVAPLIGIQATQEPAPPGLFEHVIFLSEHAVSHAFPSSLAVSPEAQWYAIGPTTAAALAEVAGSYVDANDLVLPRVATSEGLLALTALTNIRARHVVIVAGEDGRETLAAQLIRRGALVEQWLVYRRVLKSAPRALRVVPAELDACIASSAAVLTELTRIWAAGAGDMRTPLCVPSQRVADAANELGWRHLVVSDGSGAAAVAAALARLKNE